MESVPLEEVLETFDVTRDQIQTTFEGWSSLKNGALLTAAEEAAFDLFIPAIKNSAISKT
jgi:hypothetical protein